MKVLWSQAPRAGERKDMYIYVGMYVHTPTKLALIVETHVCTQL